MTKFLQPILIPMLSLMVSATAHAMGSHLPATDDDALSAVLTMKPAGSEDLGTAKTLCQKLSDNAKNNGLNTLVIAFEGLASFDASGTQAAYVEHWNLTHNRPATTPNQGSGGFLLHQLVVPLMESHNARFEFLVFPHDSVGTGTSVAEVCARTWKSDPDPRARNRRLMFYGHSYGGVAVNLVAQALQKTGVPIDFVLTIDPRLRYYAGSFQRTSNVKRWLNFYELITPFLSGYTIPDADTNTDLSSEGYFHTRMPSAPAIYDAASAQL